MTNQTNAASVTVWLERIRKGAYLRELAAEAGLSKVTVHKRLRKQSGYAQAKRGAISVQLARAISVLTVERDKRRTNIMLLRNVQPLKWALWRVRRELQATPATLARLKHMAKRHALEAHRAAQSAQVDTR